jgi:uncharacterized membrane protein YeaQ/YmgE (transglycosylase-associated protein family)
MQTWLPLIIQLLSGAIGGNLVASLKKDLSLGTFWNSIAGIVGGGLGAQVLGMLGVPISGEGSLDIGGIVGSILGGGVGGGILIAIVGMIKQAMAKK